MNPGTAELRTLNADCIGEPGEPMAPAMALALDANFGSVEQWRRDIAALTQSCRDGWVLLCFDPDAGTLVHRCVADGETFAGVPLLALHAGATHDDIIGSVDRIRWPRVYQRYQDAVHDASEPLAVSRTQLSNALLLDVRRAGVFADADTLIDGAQWRDPARVDEWASECPADRELVVYCVYGHEVGRSTALRLRARGLDARFLEGGIDGWQAAGGALQPKGDGS